MLNDCELWTRLSALSLDDPTAEFPFSKRLARDNGWSHRFALRAIEEYKRFAYLAMTATHEVTPSDEVDQVWHLHLTYTRHYWGEFQEALGQPLHHNPTAGGNENTRRYTNNYETTLKRYEEAFKVKPPSDIWPPSAKRFGIAPFYRRLNTTEIFLLTKRKVYVALVGFAALISATLTSSWAMANEEIGPAYLRPLVAWLREEPFGHAFLLMFGLFLLYGFVKHVIFREPFERNDRNSGCTAGCSGCGGCGD